MTLKHFIDIENVNLAPPPLRSSLTPLLVVLLLLQLIPPIQTELTRQDVDIHTNIEWIY